MGEDADTRKINHSFLRDHNYVTEGNTNAIVVLFLRCIFCARNALSCLEMQAVPFFRLLFKQGDFQGILLCDVARESV